MSDQVVSEVVREQGMCGAVGADRVCILDIDHGGKHGWERQRDDERDAAMATIRTLYARFPELRNFLTDLAATRIEGAVEVHQLVVRCRNEEPHEGHETGPRTYCLGIKAPQPDDAEFLNDHSYYDDPGI